MLGTITGKSRHGTGPEGPLVELSIGAKAGRSIHKHAELLILRLRLYMADGLSIGGSEAEV